MKQVVSCISLIFFISGCGVFKIMPPQGSQYERNVICSGNHDELYEKANKWLVQTIKNATSIESRIDVQDKQKGRMSALYITGITSHPMKTETPVRIHIYVKDYSARILCEFDEQARMRRTNVGDTFFGNEIERSEVADNSGGNAEIIIKSVLNDFVNYMQKE
jgi:hypothetical protein